MFSGLALRTRRILHGFCMVFACGTACAFFCMTRTACTVLHGFCMWNSLHVFLHDTNSLHGFARFLHVEQLARFFARFCMVFAWFLHVEQLARFFARFCMVLHVFFARCCMLHVFSHSSTPCPSPVFFPVRPYVGSSWTTSLRGRAVPSGHLGSAERALVTKRAERAQCRAGTSN